MTTDVRLKAVNLDAMPSTCASDQCTNNLYANGDEGRDDDVPSPLASHSPAAHLPGNLNRRFSQHVGDSPSRYRSPSGDSTNTGGARSSPLTNIMFLDDFIKEEIGSGFFATVYKVCCNFNCLFGMSLQWKLIAKSLDT